MLGSKETLPVTPAPCRVPYCPPPKRGGGMLGQVMCRSLRFYGFLPGWPQSRTRVLPLGAPPSQQKPLEESCLFLVLAECSPPIVLKSKREVGFPAEKRQVLLPILPVPCSAWQRKGVGESGDLQQQFQTIQSLLMLTLPKLHLGWPHLTPLPQDLIL